MEDSQLMEYVPVLILGLAAVGFSFGTLVLSDVFGRVFNRTCKLAQHAHIKDSL